ncbi:hypothetical protein COU17_01830 [Candidatus Kaiserbacteria bacterium CG10_big_fil_rev_8_21_14_0_10_49_17]|uniref:Type II secretion system protein J n=1 Tax=Candidatus Kaiserbacteria bacterium CG10_big_fil_rev_8_21_14_0_10_49_17 TaxID=1974609 RepID=A0A2M6WEG7_9BACT|nr:MAG: hypothetical protein COU17_01830 [Candidatus Kaiserbacteria bacterium CG10_big_fil_rev_8_21_14_0_10_49_17]
MHTRGFTFIETIVVISIFTVMIGAIVSSVLAFYRGNTNALEQSYAVNSARRGVEFAVRDMREATYSDEGAYPIISIDPQEFYFYSDIDRDNSVERVRYFADGTFLYKGVTESAGDPPTYSDANEVTSIISEDVRNGEQGVSIFRYYDETGNEVVDFDAGITDVVFVSINLIVNINPIRLPNEFTLRSSATLRNLKPTQ